MEQITVESTNELPNEPSSLTIHFEGICTHILQREDVPLPVPRRIVLVHAEDGRTINGHPIPPHRAFLKVDTMRVRAMTTTSTSFLEQQPDNNWQIKGARIRVNNPKNVIAGQPSPFIPNMPSLQQLTKDLGQLKHDVVYGSDAACHFDVESGAFSGMETSGGSFDAILKVATEGDPVLRIEDIKKPEGTDPVLLTLTPGTTVTISNAGRMGPGDTPYDFLLHYLIFETIPKDAGIPSEKIMAFDGLGPGCSNSNYP